MKRPPRLSDAEIETRLASLSGWVLAHGTLRREFSFRDFSEAFGFMARVALVAEKMDHHPDWSNAWNRVTVELRTHDAGGLTTLDFELAAAMDRLAGPPPR
jgi:4a-hydroxytetrahydrobiopterin dehydratase